MARDTWRELLEAAQAGKATKVLLTPGQRIVRPKRRPGRPRVRGATAFGHYAGYDPAKGGRPRCARRGCGKRLKRDERFACSPEHAQQAIDQARTVLGKGQVT